MPKGILNKPYTLEFKVPVVETMQKERLSYCKAARQFEVGDDKRVAAWERIYLTEGLAACFPQTTSPHGGLTLFLPNLGGRFNLP